MSRISVRCGRRGSGPWTRPTSVMGGVSQPGWSGGLHIAGENGGMSEPETEQRSVGKRANELNAGIRYTMWSVFRLARPLGDEPRTVLADEVQALIEELAGKDVVVRGT